MKCRSFSLTSTVTGNWPWAFSAVPGMTFTELKMSSDWRSPRKPSRAPGEYFVLGAKACALGDESMVRPVEPLDRHRPERRHRPRIGREGDVQRVRRVIYQCGLELDQSERMTRPHHLVQEVTPRGDDVGGTRRRTGLQIERGLDAVGAGDVDLADLVERAGCDGDGDRSFFFAASS